MVIMECWRCNETVADEAVRCTFCGADLAEVVAPRNWVDRKNWLSNFSYGHRFAVLFYPGVVVLCLLLVYKVPHEYLFLKLLYFSFFAFVSANYSEKRGEVRSKFASYTREKNPIVFNLAVNLMVVLSVMTLLAAIIYFFQPYTDLIPIPDHPHWFK